MAPRVRRLFNLSAFGLTVLGVLAGTALLALTQGREGEAARSLRVQGMLLTLLLLGLALVFKVQAALGARPASERAGTRNLRVAGGGLLVVAMLNLAMTLRAGPGGAVLHALGRTHPALAQRVAALSSDALAQGLFLSVALTLLALYAFLTALLGAPPGPTEADEDRETTKVRKAPRLPELS